MTALIKLALQEDLQETGDVTSSAVFNDETGTFTLVSKDTGVLCGMDTAREVLKTVDPAIKVTARIEDGSDLEVGTVVAELSGPTASILTAERTMLNFLSHLSGIATKTRKYVEHAKGSTILDTRKTIPGMRVLEKYAVACGGGRNHRMGLFDMVMIKDNHIDAAGGITNAVARVRNKWGDTYAVEVEARTLADVREALDCKVERIMLDNMSNELMRQAVDLVDRRAETEASGNITLERLESIAATGVEFISVGGLTHTVEAFDFSLKQGVLIK